MAWISDHCPDGFRFLYQAIGARTWHEAYDEVWRTFRRTDAYLVRGVYRRQGYKTENDPWIFDESGGYLAFVPGKENSRISTCNRRRVGVKP